MGGKSKGLSEEDLEKSGPENKGILAEEKIT